MEIEALGDADLKAADALTGTIGLKFERARRGAAPILWNLSPAEQRKFKSE